MAVLLDQPSLQGMARDREMGGVYQSDDNGDGDDKGRNPKEWQFYWTNPHCRVWLVTERWVVFIKVTTMVMAMIKVGTQRNGRFTGPTLHAVVEARYCRLWLATEAGGVY